MSIYTEQGYKSRQDYLEGLAEDYGVDLNMVLIAASMLGPNEDFDGLVTTIQDESEYC